MLYGFTRRRGETPTPDAAIDAVEVEMAEAVSAAMERRRAGEPAEAELEKLKMAMRRRKQLYRAHTTTFA